MKVKTVYRFDGRTRVDGVTTNGWSLGFNLTPGTSQQVTCWLSCWKEGTRAYGVTIVDLDLRGLVAALEKGGSMNPAIDRLLELKDDARLTGRDPIEASAFIATLCRIMGLPKP